MGGEFFFFLRPKRAQRAPKEKQKQKYTGDQRHYGRKLQSKRLLISPPG